MMNVFGELHLLRGILMTWIGVFLMLQSPAGGASVEQIGEGSRHPMRGKEIDWIDGDYVLRNDQVVAVIARPNADRHANMTVRSVGACIIDFTRLDAESDQLSCYYPLAGRYQFFDNGLVETGDLDGGGVFWRCRSTAATARNETVATIEYQLRDGDPYLTVIKTVTGEDVSKVTAADSVRADTTFVVGTLAETTTGYCEDEHFRQTYGFEATLGTKTPLWSASGRNRQLKYGADAAERSENRVQWITRIYAASSPLDLWGLTSGAKAQRFSVSGAVGEHPRIKLSVIAGSIGSLELPCEWRSAADGKSVVHLPPGQYRVRGEAIGHLPVEADIKVTSESSEFALKLGAATTVQVTVVSEDGQPIPCKASFYGAKDEDGNMTPDPVFGIESQSGAVGNCVYCADGQFVRSLPPGTYDLLLSRGPEYDAVFEKIQIAQGQQRTVRATLKRVVDTTGWVSAELHSHSSPSGDNTSDQLGRVENLVCEQIDFAPCTEHQRIESYDDQLEKLGAQAFMATCTGMELTGSPLPLNHQNAFPLKWKPYSQDGGGPKTSSNPVTQIARLAMWDDNSDKLVQTNHPNVRQLVEDRDLDGNPDGGFAKMLDFMDVMEVHPPENIFMTSEEVKAMKRPGTQRILPWMELLKSGRRIPGVVNTDAHYNWNGSGWLRNWVRSSTDEPAKIRTAEMVDRLEKGQVIMSTGPFMTVQLHHPGLEAPAAIGDSVTVDGAGAKVAIKVQCANWMDVNRVEVFVNGEMQPELSRTRKTHPQDFGNGVVKFDQHLGVTLPVESFVIVAAIGERMELGRVMGKRYGRRPPVVVSNPIFVTTNLK
ncbi:MAG: CehA/McbA family metallohydrolase [Rubripirellula sp.]|nr:CehA/McbA family metallohydrolase [Rubripirellula sp.]